MGKQVGGIEIERQMSSRDEKHERRTREGNWVIRGRGDAIFKNVQALVRLSVLLLTW